MFLWDSKGEFLCSKEEEVELLLVYLEGYSFFYFFIYFMVVVGGELSIII